MNERIKEFRFKAAEYANEQKPLGLMKWNELRDAKFAELIVRECTNIVLHYTDVDEGVAVAKKHFGVE